MNTQTTELLKHLADKLGTTTQYLWSVLLNQAHVSATITLIQMLTGVIFVLVLCKYHFNFLKKYPDAYYENKRLTNNYNESDYLVPLMGVLAVFAIVTIVVIICNIGDVINGYFNPEYWALDKIISTAKGN